MGRWVCLKIRPDSEQGSVKIPGLERSARIVSQERASLMDKERAGWAAVQERAILILTVKAAAPRRRLKSLLEQE